MIEQRGEGRDGSPFLRTLHGGAGVVGSEVVTSESGKVYKLGGQIGTTGNVFDLPDGDFAQPVVIKLFPRAAGIDERAIGAFVQTARRAGGLAHPHIARVFDAGALENGTPFLVVEKLRGETLRELLSGGATLPPAESLAILRAIGDTLSAAHAAGIVHGELRPDNVFAVLDGERDRNGGAGLTSVKLLDFGAARLTAPLRQMGMSGSDEELSYLGPEQAQLEVRPEAWDGRADEYALAVLAHRLLAQAEARRSPALTAVLTMAMNQHPADRFISVAQFMGALDEVIAAGPPIAVGSARETLKPLGDMDVTPIGPSMAQDPMARRTPGVRESSPSYGALTRQFFEDGNRMSEEASAARLRRPSSLSMSAASMRIPTSAARKVAVVLAAASVIAVVLAAWAGVRNPVMALRTRARVLFSPRPSAVSAPASNALAAAPAETARPSLAGEGAVTAMVRPAMPPAAPIPMATGRVPTVDRTALDPPPSSTNRQAGAKPAETANAEHPGASSSSRSSRRAHSASRWSDPLHGYVWSPTEQRLVPAERAETPPPSEWPPPAAQSASESPSPSSSSSSAIAPSPSSSPSPAASPPALPRTASSASPPAGTAMSSPLLDLPMPMSSGSTEPPPQPAPPIIDDSDDGPKPPARPAPTAPPRQQP